MKRPLDGIAQLSDVARPGVVVVAQPLGDFAERWTTMSIGEPIVKCAMSNGMSSRRSRGGGM